MRYLIIALLLGFYLISSAQRAVPAKVPLSFQWAMRDEPNARLVHLFLKGNQSLITDFVTEHGGSVKYPFREYLAVCLPPEAVSLIDQLAFVESVHFEHCPGMPLLASARVHTGVNLVHAGYANLPDIYKGAGVIMGIIDAGIELQHPDFRTANGNTRIIELWDQNMAFDINRTPSYGYGQVWDSASINDSLCPHVDQMQYYGHGTNTAGIAAGNGISGSDYTGMAPQSELIVVSSNLTSAGWTATVADAVDYIFGRAEALGRPCVINVSLGTYLGSHDARDLAAMLIEEDITDQAGRIMVCAAGNAGNEAPFHLGYEATQDTGFTWIKMQNGASPGNGLIGFEMCGDVDDFERVQFAIGADRVSPSYQLRGMTAYDSVLNRVNVIYTDTLFSHAGNYLATVRTFADSLNGTYRMQVLVEWIDSIDYKYRLSITGNGRLDIWSANWLGYRDMEYTNLPYVASYPEMAKYKYPDNFQSMVSSWACSEKVITVGNFINRTTYTDVDENVVSISGITSGEIAATSSLGPARTGAMKPDISAPGDNILTAGAFYQLQNLLNYPPNRSRVGVGGLHHRAGGTSSASPVVAGIAALYLEKCNAANWLDFKLAITENATQDLFTGSLPNYQWGHGKIDAVAALRTSTPHSGVTVPVHEFCGNEFPVISLQSSFPVMQWNNGDTGLSTLVNTTGLYYATIVDEKQCKGYSDTVALYRRPLPAKPLITVEGNNPSCANETVTLAIAADHGAYSWSNGSHLREIIVEESGLYACTVENIYGCSRHSDTVAISFLQGSEKPELHFKADGNLYAILDSTQWQSIVWYLNGTTLQVQDPLVIEDPVQGVYQIECIDSNACVQYSESINVYALGMSEDAASTPLVHPVPFDRYILIDNPGNSGSFQLYDPLGKLLLSGSVQSGRNEIHVGGVAKGLYILKLMNGAEEYTIKLIR